MKFNEKTELRNRLKNKGVTLNAEQTNEVARYFDELFFEEHKNRQESKMSIRLIYTVIFAIVTITTFIHSSLTHTIIIGIIWIYNLIHFLSDYVFYHNNFRSKYVKKNSNR